MELSGMVISTPVDSSTAASTPPMPAATSTLTTGPISTTSLMAMPSGAHSNISSSPCAPLSSPEIEVLAVRDAPTPDATTLKVPPRPRLCQPQGVEMIFFTYELPMDMVQCQYRSRCCRLCSRGHTIQSLLRQSHLHPPFQNQVLRSLD